MKCEAFRLGKRCKRERHVEGACEFPLTDAEIIKRYETEMLHWAQSLRIYDFEMAASLMEEFVEEMRKEK